MVMRGNNHLRFLQKFSLVSVVPFFWYHQHRAFGFVVPRQHQQHHRSPSIILPMSPPPRWSSSTSLSLATTAAEPMMSWAQLNAESASTTVGKALNEQVQLRKTGQGSASRENTLRTFGKSGKPAVTLYRDSAAWCPYCQKAMLLVEEKEIPMNIELINMRSYGDKPQAFLRKIPSGLLPAIEVKGQVVTESQVIMELLDEWFPESQGYKRMQPRPEDTERMEQYQRLAALERDLFRWWCTVVFRPEASGPFAALTRGGGMSAAMNGFMDCIKQVDQYLLATDGPWFFDEFDHPTMIDFIYVSHVERMLASLAYWKGVDLRDLKKWNLKGLVQWLEAFEKREAYLAFKSDYYTHVMDIPPQYGPGYDGGFEKERKQFANSINGRDGKSWHLPLGHDDPLQPLYKGPPLPLCVLEAMNLHPSSSSGSYEACDETIMAKACRSMAAWKLASNGANVAKFAARGGPEGAKNPRKTFSAPLADPYAESDVDIQPTVDAVLRIVCRVMLLWDDDVDNNKNNKLPSAEWRQALKDAVPAQQVDGVVSSLGYLRDRVGIPRDLPLAAARYLRAYLNWAIDALE